MTSRFEHLKIKLKLFYPIFFGMLIAILAISILSVRNMRKSIHESVVENLSLEVNTIKSMFERERDLKMEKVKYDLRVAHDLFYRNELVVSSDSLGIEVVNQITLETHFTRIPVLLWNNKSIYKNYSFVDKVSFLSGGTATLFQQIDSGFVRVSTNVMDDDSTRAIHTFIPNSSPVIQTIRRGETYMGRAYVVNDWYITAYEPIFINDELVGILYVGDQEKEIDQLRRILQNLRIGETGYVFAFDKELNMIVEPGPNKELLEDEVTLYNMMGSKENFIFYDADNDGDKRVVSYSYYPDFELYIGASVSLNEVEKSQVNNVIFSGVFSMIIILIIFTLYVFFITNSRVQSFLVALRKSGQELETTRDALKKSEENFETLFNNTSDEIFVTDMSGKIIFVNQRAIDILGYSLNEFNAMTMVDLKTDYFKSRVAENRKKILEKGEAIFDSEHVSRNGEVFPVEIKSRVIEINKQKAILSISRNMAERKEMERKLLSVVIQTEEKERERFSKDMHDGLGPLLSTIKLYVNELESDDIGKEEKEQYITYVNELLDEAVSNTRTISNNLMPRVIHEYGLVKALESFCRKVNQTNKIEINFNAFGIEDDLDQNVQLILFRVVNELINNTLKHAQAEHIEIKINKSGNHIDLIFSDDGVGFDVEEVMNKQKAGIGLKSIFSRISSIKGKSKIISEPGDGSRIEIQIDI